MDEIPLPEAARRTGLSWASAHRRAMYGDFGPVRQVAGRWLVTAAGVEAYLQRRSQTPQTAACAPAVDTTPTAT